MPMPPVLVVLPCRLRILLSLYQAPTPTQAIYRFVCFAIQSEDSAEYQARLLKQAQTLPLEELKDKRWVGGQGRMHAGSQRHGVGCSAWAYNLILTVSSMGLQKLSHWGAWSPCPGNQYTFVHMVGRGNTVDWAKKEVGYCFV